MRRAFLVSLLVHAAVIAALATWRIAARDARAPAVEFRSARIEAPEAIEPPEPDPPLPETAAVRETFDLEDPNESDEAIDERLPVPLHLPGRRVPIAHVRIRDPRPASAPPPPTRSSPVSRPAPAAEPASQPARPRPDGCPPPSYPPLARRRGQSGTVRLRISIDASGGVDAVKVEGSSGYPLLDRAALRAARRWRFSPAQEGGRPVSTEILQPVEFRLR